jgi:copper resistance protein B
MSGGSMVSGIVLAVVFAVAPALASGQEGVRPEHRTGTHGHGAHVPPGDERQEPKEPEQPMGQRDQGNHVSPGDQRREPGDAERAEHPAGGTSPPQLRPITDEDRAAAFPELRGQHTVHDDGVHGFVLFDQAEWQGGDGASAFNVDSKGWIGRDIDRLWFRAEGEGHDGDVEALEAHLLYGRMIARWWDVVGGIRQDVRPGPSRTWAAIGLQGLAPYWFEVEATAYIGSGGRTHFRFETEYELLLTNRLILQPLVEMEIYGKSDPERGIGAGLSTLETGLRLRYEFKREFAPYVGVVWSRKFFGTADLAEAAGEDTREARVAVGVRFWF